MAQLRLSVELANQWINNPESIPDEWKKVLTKRKWIILESVANGFGIENGKGDSCITDMTPKQFNIWAKSQGCCRVWIESSKKNKMNSAIKVLWDIYESKKGFNSYDSTLAYNAYNATRKIAEKENDFYCKFIRYSDYLGFYKKGKKHEVDMVDPIFFEKFPLAKEHK